MSDLISNVVSSKNRSPARLLPYGSPRVIEQTQIIKGGVASEFRDNSQSQTQSVTVVTAPPKFFFDMKVFKAQPDKAQLSSWIPLDVPVQLEAGYEYQIEVSTSLNENCSANESYDMRQWPVVVSVPIDMYIRPSKTIPGLIISHALSTVMPGEETEHFHHTFLLTVETQCPFDNLALELMYRDNAVEKRATRLPVMLEGSYHEPEKELWTRVSIDENTRPPASMALLHVETAEQGKLRLSCWNRSPLPHRPSFLKPIEQPKLGLDTVELNIHNPQAIQEVINNINNFFNVRASKLSEWFFYVVETHQEQSCVVIVDETAANIPWEMLEVDKDKYLGTEAIVVRWAESQYRRLHAVLNLQQSEQHIGAMLAYVHSKDQACAIQECPILADLTSEIYTSEKTLKTHLSLQKLSQTGLVYMHYRGSFIYGDEPIEILPHLQSSYGESVQVQFAGVEAPVDNRPVVFVNACHSARILWNGSDSYGLVKIFLAKFAAGYIGPIGSVEPSYASQIAHNFLQNASNLAEDGVALAEELRRLRRNAVNTYLQDRDLLANQIALIHTFMYVYYGNPYARLRLKKIPIGEIQQEQKNDQG